MGTSVGVATRPAGRSTTPEDLLREADAAMYRAKLAERGQEQGLHPGIPVTR